MRSLKAFALVATVVTLGSAMPASAGGPGTVSKTYDVGGLSVPGVVTGFVVKPGQTVTVTATGAVCPFSSSFCPGPNGYSPWDTTDTTFGGFPLPGAPAWGLIGRVGSGPWVQLGNGPTTLSGSGAVAFAVNDDLLVDNVGSFTVTVSYTCWPGWGYGDKNHTHCGPPGLVGTSPQVAKGQAKAKGQAPGQSQGQAQGQFKGQASADEARGNSADAHAQNDGANGKGSGKHDR